MEVVMEVKTVKALNYPVSFQEQKSADEVVMDHGSGLNKRYQRIVPPSDGSFSCAFCPPPQAVRPRPAATIAPPRKPRREVDG